jgi:phosphohistidine phosphatase
MRLYLVQHGEAKSKDADPDRHLTDRGSRDVEKVAAFLEPLKLGVSAVRHSGKTRAAETAEILAGALAAEEGVVERAGLAPNDPVEPLGNELAEVSEDLMIVGHLPFMDRLASLLVAGSESVGAIAFRNAGVVCLERAEDPGGRLPAASRDSAAQAGDIQPSACLCRARHGRQGRRGGAWRALWTVIPEILP